MKNILDEAQGEVLARLARSNALLGFDFDGTLAPIVDDPDGAGLRPTTRALLVEVASRYPCVVISGRAARDVEQRLGGVALRGVIGNHGVEPPRSEGSLHDTVVRWRAHIEPLLAHYSGVEVEDKGFSLAIHYRRSQQKEEALRGISRALAELGEIRVVGGKQVVNVLPLGAPHKGIALEAERERLGCDTAFFIGDDETDEDVFALDQPHLLTVHVGQNPDSRAGYCLPDQSEIDTLLGRLIELRS